MKYIENKMNEFSYETYKKYRNKSKIKIQKDSQ